jgi:hypothetical protein
MCAVITRCHTEVNESQCEVGVLASSGIDYQLGLPKGMFGAFAEIMQAEEAGNLVANSSAYNSCSVAVDNLSCSDSTVQNAYDKLTNSFAGVPFMVPTAPGSCPMVFNQPPLRREYYVSTTGSDSNDGSAARPWATINHASQALQPTSDGAIVHVAPGTYTVAAIPACASDSSSCGVNTRRSGTSTAPIIYISDQQWAAKIVAPSASTTWYNAGDYVQIIGFELIGTATSNAGIFSEAAFGKMIGNHIHSIPMTKACATNSSGAGIFFGWLANAHDNDAIGNRIHDLGPKQPNGLAISSYCLGMANGISYRQPRGKIYNNIIYGVANYAVSTWHMASNLEISHNLLFNNGNLASGNTPNGGGIAINGENNVGVHDNTTVSNNIIRNNSGKGLNEWVSVGRNNAYMNNVIFANGFNYDVNSGSPITGTIAADPMMVNFTMDGSGDYSLRANSVAIDAGTINCTAAIGNGNCSPTTDILGFERNFGGGADLGPYEWHP